MSQSRTQPAGSRHGCRARGADVWAAEPVTHRPVGKACVFLGVFGARGTVSALALGTSALPAVLLLLGTMTGSLGAGAYRSGPGSGSGPAAAPASPSRAPSIAFSVEHCRVSQ